MTVDCDSSALFDESDVELLDQLVVPMSATEDCFSALVTPQKLAAAFHRFHLDVDASREQDFWITRIQALAKVGIVAVEEVGNTLSEISSVAALPAAFETASGTKHLVALVLLLRISRIDAVRLTLSALRDLQNHKHLQSLLGTQALFQMVLSYHYRQRSARLSIVAECLRMEQDADCPAFIRQQLDTMDQTYKMNGKCKKIFRRLIFLSTAPAAPLLREQLMVLKQLHGSNEHFLSTVTEEPPQREDAMEALLVLLYSRVKVSRSDLILLLQVFASCHCFFTDMGKDQLRPRLPHLCALVCAECFSLWCTYGFDWVDNHPILTGVLQGDKTAEQELEVVQILLGQYGNTMVQRRVELMASTTTSSEFVVETPESLAMLAFGLLLRLAYASQPTPKQPFNMYWHKFKDIAMESVQMASDQMGAFNYLDSVLRTLLATTNSLAAATPTSAYCEHIPHDWQFPALPQILHSELTCNKLDAAAMAYTSIGLELITCILSAFSDSILTCTENITMMANLAAIIFSNHAEICEPFWNDFETFDADSSMMCSPNHQIGVLLNVAYNLAATAMNQGEDRRLSAVAPLMRLVSSLCCNSRVCSLVMTMLPSDFICNILSLCAPFGCLVDETSHSATVFSALEAISTMAKLDAPAIQNAIQKDGLKLIFQILSVTKDESVKQVLLQLLGYLMNDGWALSAAKLFNHDGLHHYIMHPTLGGAAVDILNGLVVNMTLTIFNNEGSEKEMMEYLKIVLRSILDACSVYATSDLSFTTQRPKQQGNISLSILQTLSIFIRSTRQIVSLHPSSQLRSAASTARDLLIQTLATSTQLGCALAHAACSPVTSSLALSMRNNVDEANLLNLVSGDYADEESNQFGEWRKVARNISSVDTVCDKNFLIHERLTNIQDVNLDIAAFCENVWDDNDAIRLAAEAINILGLWAVLVEDMLAERFDLNETLPEDAISYIKALSPYHLMSSLAPVPPLVRESLTLSRVWRKENMSVLDVVTRYLAGNGNHPTFCTLDLLTICIQHGTATRDQNPALHRAVESNGQLSLALRRSLQKTCSDLTRLDSHLVRMRKIILMQGIHTLHLLRAMVIRHHSYIPFLFDSAVLESLNVFLSSVVSSMQEQGTEIHDRLATDDSLLIKMRFVSEILKVFVCIQKLSCFSAKTIPTAISHHLASKSFMSNLSSMASAIVSSVSSGTSNALRVTTVLNYCLSCSYELIANQVSTEMNENDRSDTVEIATELTYQNEGNHLFGSHDFLHLVGPVLTSQSFVALKLRTHSIAKISNPSSLRTLFPSATKSRIGSSICSRCDDVEATSWLSLLIPSENFSAIVQDMDTSVSLLDSELAVISSWSRIAQVLLLVSGNAPSTTTRRITQEFYQNCEELVKAREHDIESMLCATITISESFSSALAPHYQLWESCGSQMMSGEVLHLLSTIIANLSHLRLSDELSLPLQKRVSEIVCLSQQRILSCCTSFVMVIQQSISNMNEFEDVLIRLIEATGACVGHVTQSISRPHHVPSSTQKLCTVALSVLNLCISVGNAGPSFITKAAKSFTSHSVLKNLVSTAIKCALGESEKSSIEFIDATFDLISMIANVGKTSTEMLTLLFDPQLQKLLLFSPIIVYESRRWSETALLDNESIRYRGYVQTGKNIGSAVGGVMAPESDHLLLTGRDDPLHSLWINAIGVMTTLVRAPFYTGAEVKKNTFFIDMAFEFVKTHGAALLSCIQNCHTAAGSASVLTYNLIIEATHVLSLVAELCQANNKIKFERCCPEHYHDLLRGATSIIGSLAKFLGSSGTARELFTLLRKVEASANQDVNSDGYDQPKDIHPAFSSGIPSGRHEAIRNAHLSRRCYALVTKSEYDASSADYLSQASSVQYTASTLELNCERVVNSPFHLKMEYATALCMSYAISIRWRAHPVSSCFLMFSECESRRLNPMSLVKPGMIIAVRDTDGLDELQFACVNSVDTVNCTWKVSYLQSPAVYSLNGRNEAVVHAYQFAGVDDPMQRKTVLSYFAAPDYAAELESESLGTTLPSVGHLILALRWCYQHLGEGTPEDLVVRRSLATGSALLLGTELSLHCRIETNESQQNEATTKRLNEQLFSMIEETPLALEGDLARTARQDRAGRLKMLLGLNIWSGIKQQLQCRVDVARVGKHQEQEHRKAAVFSTHPWGAHGPF